MKKYLPYFLSLSLIISSCVKKADQVSMSVNSSNSLNSSTSLKDRAISSLKVAMTYSDFMQLDWDNSIIEKSITGTDMLIKIPSKFDSAKTLFYAEKNGHKYFNWVQYLSKKNSKTINPNTLNVYSIDNRLINSYDLSNYSAKMDQKVQTNLADNGNTLPDVVVYCSLNSDYTSLLSLYYILGNGTGGETNVWYPSYTQGSNINSNNTLKNSGNVAEFYLVPGRNALSRITTKVNSDGTKTITICDKVPYNPFNFYIVFNVNQKNQLILNSQYTYTTGITIGIPFAQYSVQNPNPSTDSYGILHFQMQGYEDISYGFGHLTTGINIDISVNFKTNVAVLNYTQGGSGVQ